MKRQLLFMCFISLIQLTVAQNYVHEFGKFSNEEFELKKYDKDPTAEAVVIYDIGKSYFGLTDDGFVVYFERTMKIKILSKAGLKWSEISIPYYEEDNKFEEITELKGNTYNFENGQIRTSALNPKNTFKEKVNEHWYEKKFAMPDVKEGSVIEVSYKIKSPYIFNFRGWEFQNKIPVMYSEYTTKMIPFYEYQFILQGATRFSDTKKYVDPGISNRLGSIEYKDMVYVYIMKDLPAFKDEAYITSANDYIIKLDFQLCAIHRPTGANESVISTWPKLSEGLLDNEAFGKYLKSCKKKCSDIVDTMRLASKSLTQKAQIIERYVKKNFSWNGDDNLYSNKSVKSFLAGKTGNSAEINLFLAGMLNAAGIEANPVILSTRAHGKIKLDYPFLHFFNSVIVLAKIDSSTVLLDATEPLSVFTEIPSRCLNDKGLVVQKDNVAWVSLKSNSVSNIVYDLNLKIDMEKDSIIQQSKLITEGYEAIDYRNKYNTEYKKLKENLIGRNVLSSDTIKAIELNQYQKPFELSFVKKTPLEKVEDKIIISPFCNFPITENPLKQATRSYPVDLIYKRVYQYQSTITIPKGYKLLSKPENIRVSNDLIRLVISSDTQNGDVVKVVGIYEFKKDEYGPTEYVDLKNYFNKIVDKFNEKVVLVKI